MTTHKVTVELPEAVFQQLTRIAELTHQPVEALAVQSITSNLPPSADNVPLEMQADLLMMQSLSNEELIKIAQGKVSASQTEQHLELLAKNKDGVITLQEREKLRNFGLVADQLMLRKAYAWSILRWRGYRLPSLEELPTE